MRLAWCRRVFGVVAGLLFQWLRHGVWLWTIGGLFAVAYLLRAGRSLARLIDGGQGHAIDAIEEGVRGVAPLVLFGLIWLLADVPQPPGDQATVDGQAEWALSGAGVSERRFAKALGPGGDG